MDVSIGSEDNRRMAFTLSGARTGFANLVRRYAMNQVPVFAIDKVTVYENTSSLFDEYIAHRIGLVPLKTPPMVKDDEEALFTLEATGPAMIYSGQLASGHDKIKVATEKIPLLQLLTDQNLRLEAKATAGIGRKHAKWQAGLAAYEMANDEFHFKVESFLQMPPRDMIGRAADLLEQKCSEMEEGLKTIKADAKAKKKEE